MKRVSVSFVLPLVLCVQSVAATYTVTTASDTVDKSDHVMSLREAIVAANTNVGTDGRCLGANKINFNIPSTNMSSDAKNYYQIKINFRDPSYKKGSVPSPLPTIRCPVSIDGFTQPATNSALAPSPGAPLIELSGEDILVGSADATKPSETPDDEERYAAGLTFVGRDSINGKKLLRDPSGSTIRGLMINKFPLHAIYLYGVDDSTIVGNFFGLDVSGEKDGFYNGRDLSAIHAGVRLEASNRNVIGTTMADHSQNKIKAVNRNYFGSNQAVQLSLVDLNARDNGYGRCNTDPYPTGCRHPELGSSKNIVQGNYFGLNKTGTRILGGFCSPKTPRGTGMCSKLGPARFSAYASVFFQSIPEGSGMISSIRDNVIGGEKPGEGNVMAGSIESEVILGATQNKIVGNTIFKDDIRLPTKSR